VLRKIVKETGDKGLIRFYKETVTGDKGEDGDGEEGEGEGEEGDGEDDEDEEDEEEEEIFL
jgi:hypothetical protein